MGYIRSRNSKFELRNPGFSAIYKSGRMSSHSTAYLKGIPVGLVRNANFEVCSLKSGI